MTKSKLTGTPDAVQYFYSSDSFSLEFGGVLPELKIAYNTFGTLNEAKDNVVWVFHALTANSDPTDWWAGLVDEQSLISPDNYFIVCANFIGSPYGSTSPLSINPETGMPYGDSFPMFSLRDTVKAHHLLFDHLELDHIALAIGGSCGGNQALEFVLERPERVKRLAVLASGAKESAWSIASHTAQRMAIEADPTWTSINGGQNGIRAARGIALLNYRTYSSFVDKQSDVDERLDAFSASSYIRHQGNKLEKRFNALCYHYLLKALDTHDIGRKRGGAQEALSSITLPTLVIGLSSDQLIPIEEQEFLAKYLTDCTFHCINSKYGHDGFLIETDQITNHLKNFLKA